MTVSVKVPMTLNSEKKHSVRYDASAPDAALSSVYVMKKDLPKPTPKTVTVTVEFE